MSKLGYSYPSGAESDPNAPWNQSECIVEDGIAEKDMPCPACNGKARWFRDWNRVSPYAGDEITHDEISQEGWHCADCDWQQEAVEEDYKRLTQFKASFGPRIDAINRAVANCKPKPAITIAGLFSGTPDGNFDWHDTNVSEEFVAMSDGEWFTYSRHLSMGRDGQSRWVETNFTDQCGDRDDEYLWSEDNEFLTTVDEARGKNDPDEFTRIGKAIANHSNEFFKGWIAYWLDCAKTGNDPLDQTTVKHDGRCGNFIEFCVESAENLAKGLTESTTVLELARRTDGHTY